MKKLKTIFKINKRIAIILAILGAICIIIPTIYGVYNYAKETYIKKELKTFMVLLQEEKIFKANMMFKNNAENNQLLGKDENTEAEELSYLGYNEYINSFGYIKSSLAKTKLIKSTVKSKDEKRVTLTVTIRRPDYFAYFKEQIKLSIKDPEYNMNDEFVKILNKDDVQITQQDYEISMEKVNNKWYIIYDDELTMALFGYNYNQY